jgi:putative protease
MKKQITNTTVIKKPKILAPAGSMDSLVTAIKAGCDEVYFGIATLNMRASAAENFTLENLKETVEYCHKHGVKTCITVNSLLYNDELDKMKEIVDAIVDSGADAAIVADMSALQYCREKGVETHISTQLSISNTDSLKFYAQFADRVVLARELTLEQVSKIVKDIKEQDIRGPKGNLVEVEVFVHGAICVAVSGRCAMSLYAYNRSANRGQCAQACRRPYKVTDITNGKELVVDNNYVMSASDLCTIGMLDKLLEAGCDVWKFEGRGRPPEYVDTVISTYKEGIDAVEKGTYDKTKIDEWNKKLGTVYNRGKSAGFYMGRTLDEWAGSNHGQATKAKIFSGKVEHYYSKIKVAQVKLLSPEILQDGEEYLIIGNTTGLVKGRVSKDNAGKRDKE